MTRLLTLVILASLAACCSGNCQCSNFVFPNDIGENVGNCERVTHTPYGTDKRMCYLQAGSFCSDRVRSVAFPRLFVSQKACPPVFFFFKRQGQGFTADETFEDEIDKRVQRAREFLTVSVPAIPLDELIKRRPQLRRSFEEEINGEDREEARQIFDDSFEEEEEEEERTGQARF